MLSSPERPLQPLPKREAVAVVVPFLPVTVAAAPLASSLLARLVVGGPRPLTCWP